MPAARWRVLAAFAALAAAAPAHCALRTATNGVLTVEVQDAGADIGMFGGGLLAATPPDRFGYVAWQDLFEAPWDTPIIGEELDSATVHYWGFVTPLVLAAGASTTFTQYAATSATAIGILPDPVAQVPTLSREAMVGMVLLLFAAAALARRTLVSS